MTDQTRAHQSRLFSVGQLSFLLEGQTLNHIGWNEQALVRMVYPAVRDADWGTVAPEILNFSATENESGVLLEWDADYRSGEIDLSVHMSIRGSADGRLAIEFDGEANRAFPFARIGLCVLLPWQSYCGKRYVATLDGTERAGVIPAAIARQYFVDGCYTPSIPPFTRFDVWPETGVQVSMDFEGDEFEMEDQRNWTDSTLKIYSTPLHLGNLHHAAAGQRIRQVVKLDASGVQCASASASDATVRLRFDGPSGHKVPSIGTTWPRALPPASGDKVPAIGLSHIRLDIDLAADEVFVASPLPPRDIPLELALWVNEKSLHRLGGVLSRLDGHIVARIIVNDADADVTTPALIRMAKATAVAAGCAVPVGGGSDFWFAEINRVAHDFTDIDFLSFTVSPQLHVFDDESVMESAALQGVVVDAAKERVASGKIVLSPITLIARDPAKDRQRQPHGADARHGGDFLTAWTAASLVSTLAAGVHALTYYELTGPNGLLVEDDGEGWSAYPVLDILRAVARRGGQDITTAISTAPQKVTGIVFGGSDHPMVLIVNCGPDGLTVELSGLPVSSLSQSSFAEGRLGAVSSSAELRAEGCRIQLAGYEVLLLQSGGSHERK